MTSFDLRSLLAIRRALPALLLGVSVAGAPAPAAAARFAGTALEQHAEIEVRDVDAATAERIAADAFQTMDRAVLQLRAIEEAALTYRPVALDPAQFALLERTMGFCGWSEGAVGPLGGEVFRLLGLRSPVTALPTPDALQSATESASCRRAILDPAASTITVETGSRLDFFPFEQGWALDRAADSIRSQGAMNFEIVVGNLRIGAGGGPAGIGWPVQPPSAPGLGEPLSSFYLRDRAFALYSPADRPLRIAGDPVVPYVDLRSGRTASGITQVMVVAELGTDAVGLAYTMFALGPTQGMLHLGDLTPRPSIRWLLGTGEGPPVIMDHNWSAVPRH